MGKKGSLKLCSTGSKNKHARLGLYLSIFEIPKRSELVFTHIFHNTLGASEIKVSRLCLKRQTIFLYIICGIRAITPEFIHFMAFAML